MEAASIGGRKCFVAMSQERKNVNSLLPQLVFPITLST